MRWKDLEGGENGENVNAGRERDTQRKATVKFGNEASESGY